MNCPACGAPVEAGTSICPICDFIIDASFLDGSVAPVERDPSDRTLPRARMPEPPREVRARVGPLASGKVARPQGAAVRSAPVRDAEGTALQPVPELEGTALRPVPPVQDGTELRPAATLARTSTASRRSPPPAVARTATSGPRGIARAATGAARTAAPADADAHTTIGTSPAPPPRGRAMPEAPGRQGSGSRSQVDYAALAQEYGEPGAGPKAPFKPERMTSPDEAFDEFRQFFGALSLSDKLTMVGAFLVVLSTFLPWKTTAAEGEVLGVLCLGAVATALGIGAIAAVRMRVLGRATGQNPVLPWVGQLGAVSATLVWCLVFIRISWDGTLARAADGNIQVATSKPDAGVYIALVSAIVAVAGTLGGLRDHGEAQR